jgi:hypothetical protein
MTRHTLFTLLILAGSSTVLATTPSPSAIPLVDKHFSYPSGIVRLTAVYDVIWLDIGCLSLNTQILPAVSVDLSPATIYATRPLKAPTPFAKRRSSIAQMVCTNDMQSSPCPRPICIDFCLWAPQIRNSTISDTEGETVAWCTKPGRGTRLIPPGALQGVQFMKTADYVQAVGFIDQTQINMAPGDSGGELDPHGTDGVSVCAIFF